MKIAGDKPDQLEWGNAWDDLYQGGAATNWIVGATGLIPVDSLRFMQQENAERGIAADRAKNVAVKWFIHQPTDPAEWGANKPTSVGRTLSLLTNDGEFELFFSDGHARIKVTLDRPGDFAIWGAGLEHSWTVLKTSAIVTIRWQPD